MNGWGTVAAIAAMVGALCGGVRPTAAYASAKSDPPVDHLSPWITFQLNSLTSPRKESQLSDHTCSFGATVVPIVAGWAGLAAMLATHRYIMARRALLSLRA